MLNEYDDEPENVMTEQQIYSRDVLIESTDFSSENVLNDEDI